MNLDGNFFQTHRPNVMLRLVERNVLDIELQAYIFHPIVSILFEILWDGYWFEILQNCSYRLSALGYHKLSWVSQTQGPITRLDNIFAFDNGTAMGWDKIYLFVWHCDTLVYWFSDGAITINGSHWDNSDLYFLFADDREKTSTSIGVFGWLLFGLSWCLVAVTLPFSLCVLLKVNNVSLCHWLQLSS